MLGKTHRMGGAVAALGGYTLLKHNGHLVSDIAPLIQLAVIYPFAMWGSIAPDLDHHADSIPAKDPVSKLVHKVLHAFNKPADKIDDTLGLFKHKTSPFQKLIKALKCTHRAWQTHSEVTAILLWYIYMYVVGQPTSVENTVVTLVLTGLILGILSHIVLDMFTTAGVPTVLGRVFSKVLPFNIRNIRLVPKSSIFATGTLYETYVYRLLSFTATALLIYIIFEQFGWLELILR